MTEYYNLTFTTSLGKSKTLRINYPNFELTPTEVRTAAFNIMTGNVFDKEKTGMLNGIKQMQKVQVNRSAIL